ncbi:MAG: SDR family NAD(P)-dependent oxidoreductase, partial [Rhodopila sp.]
MSGLDGKVIIVTGASRGIGAAAAVALSQAGATVVLTARDSNRLADVALSIARAGGTVSSRGCDVSDYRQCASVVDEMTDRYGRVDALINNAGAIEPIASIAESDPASWARNIDINAQHRYQSDRRLPCDPSRAARDARGGWRDDRECVVRRGDPA